MRQGGVASAAKEKVFDARQLVTAAGPFKSGTESRSCFTKIPKFPKERLVRIPGVVDTRIDGSAWSALAHFPHHLIVTAFEGDHWDVDPWGH